MHEPKQRLLTPLIQLVVASLSASACAGTITTLASFDTTNGAKPISGVIADAAGNLYGTTYAGGPTGEGTVFKLVGGATATPGAIVSLATFSGPEHGRNPGAPLITDGLGNLFGTTVIGGQNDLGTVFEIVGGMTATPGAVTTRAQFNIDNGRNPNGALLMDAQHNLYGTTENGGLGRGNVFKLGGTEPQTVVNFTDAIGGRSYAPVIADAAGNLYGTTSQGGANNQGVVFRINSGQTSTPGAFITLATFDGSNGGRAYTGLIADAAGNLYGTSLSGGNGGLGVVFKIPGGETDAPGAMTTLLKLGTDAGFIPSALTMDVAGNLFCRTYGGGANSAGTVFKINGGATPTPGAVDIVASFDAAGGVDPARANSPLLADASGHLFGANEGGGTNGVGSIFRVDGAGFVSLVGDANADNHVDFSDLVVLAQHYGQTSGATWSEADFTHDGAVNFADLVILAQHYGAGTSGAAGADFSTDWSLAQSLVPEPVAAVFGFAILSAGTRRRNSRMRLSDPR